MFRNERKEKKKIVCVQARLYLNVFLPKKPAFGNSRGPWGEGRNEGGKRYFFRFPFILRVLTFEFFIVFFVCCGERFSVILRKWAMYATARARDEQKFDEICHLFDCLRLYTSGLLCWNVLRRVTLSIIISVSRGKGWTVFWKLKLHVLRQENFAQNLA